MTAKNTAPSVALADDMVAADRAARDRARSKAVKHVGAVVAKQRPLRERKPIINEVDLDMDFSDVESALDVDGDVAPARARSDPAATEAKAKPLRVKVPKSKERALIREFGLDATALTEEESEKRRSELTALVKMGKTRGFLTQQEINDHLPEQAGRRRSDRSDREDAQRHGHRRLRAGARCGNPCWSRAAQAPRRPTKKPRRRRRPHCPRSTPSSAARPTRCACTCARWALFELLTREGEIEIAKRIEGGLQAMMLAISASPSIMAEMLAYGDKVAAGEMSIAAVVDGFVVADEADDYVAEEDVDAFDDEDDEDDDGGNQAMTRRLEEMKVAALERFASMRSGFDKLRKAFEKSGYDSPAYRKAQHALSDETA